VKKVTPTKNFTIPKSDYNFVQRSTGAYETKMDFTLVGYTAKKCLSSKKTDSSKRQTEKPHKKLKEFGKLDFP